MESNSYDAIIIGGGLGGLSAAALLAKDGQKVLLLEQFARVGGYATAWKRDGVTVEGVLHEIDDIGANSQKAKLLRELGIYEVLQFVKPNEFYRVVANGLDMVVPHEGDKIKELCKELCPQETDGIDRFFSILQKIYDEINTLSDLKGFGILKLLAFPLFFPNLIRHDRTNFGEFLDGCISDNRLKLLLCANLGYYTDDPYKLSLFMFAAAQCSYYDGGGWFIKGGSQEFSDAFANAIKDFGGEVKTRCEVNKIIAENGKAKGIVYKDGKEEKIVYARVILNNASPIWAIDALDKQNAVSQKQRELFLHSQISPSAFGVYLIVKGKNAPQNRPYNTFVFDSSDGFDEAVQNIYADFDNRSFAITDYGAIDSGLGTDDRRLVVLFATSKYSEWDGLGDDEYKAKKEECTQKLLKRVEVLYPDITENLLSYEVATPLTMERYTKNPQGAIYGYTQEPLQSGRHRMKYAKILPNLINSSAWGQIGGGYSGAIYGGQFAARTALKILK